MSARGRRAIGTAGIRHLTQSSHMHTRRQSDSMTPLHTSPPADYLAALHPLTNKWPAVAALRRACDTRISSVQAAASELNYELCVCFVSAFLDSRVLHTQSCSTDILVDTVKRNSRAEHLLREARTLVTALIPAMRTLWHIKNELHLYSLIALIGPAVGVFLYPESQLLLKHRMHGWNALTPWMQALLAYFMAR